MNFIIISWQKLCFILQKDTFNVILIGLSPRWTLQPGTFMASINALYKFQLKISKKRHLFWIWYLLNSPPGAIPNSLVRWADIDRSKRYITPYKYDVNSWYRYWQTLIMIMAYSQTWTVPWLLRISRDFSMSKFCASSKIVASSRCWNGKSQDNIETNIFTRQA